MNKKLMGKCMRIKKKCFDTGNLLDLGIFHCLLKKKKLHVKQFTIEEHSKESMI